MKLYFSGIAWERALRQLPDPSYEHTKAAPLAISPQPFHSKLKKTAF